MTEVGQFLPGAVCRAMRRLYTRKRPFESSLIILPTRESPLAKPYNKSRELRPGGKTASPAIMTIGASGQQQLDFRPVINSAQPLYGLGSLLPPGEGQDEGRNNLF